MIQPLDHRLLVKRLPESETIVLTDSDGSRKALVLAVGPGKKLKNGGRRTMQVKVGDVVYLPGVSWTDPDKRDREEMLITEDDVGFIITGNAANRSTIRQSQKARFND